MSRVVRGLFLGVLLLAMPAMGLAADNAQQQRMKDCNQQATGMTGDARKTFMSSCLSGTAGTPKCTPGKSKPCGNSCISLDKTCHK
jgi:hypothetical protein